jgi:hypothetical protein
MANEYSFGPVSLSTQKRLCDNSKLCTGPQTAAARRPCSPPLLSPRKPTEREIAIAAARFLRRAVELTKTKRVSANSQSANLSFRLVVSWPVVGVLPWCRLRMGRTAPCHSVGRRGSRQLAPRTTIWCAPAPLSDTHRLLRAVATEGAGRWCLQKAYWRRASRCI